MIFTKIRLHVLANKNTKPSFRYKQTYLHFEKNMSNLNSRYQLKYGVSIKIGNQEFIRFLVLFRIFIYLFIFCKFNSFRKLFKFH